MLTSKHQYEDLGFVRSNEQFLICETPNYYFLLNDYHSYDSLGNDLGSWLRLIRMDTSSGFSNEVTIPNDYVRLLQELINFGHPNANVQLRRHKVNQLA